MQKTDTQLEALLQQLQDAKDAAREARYRMQMAKDAIHHLTNKAFWREIDNAIRRLAPPIHDRTTIERTFRQYLWNVTYDLAQERKQIAADNRTDRPAPVAADRYRPTPTLCPCPADWEGTGQPPPRYADDIDGTTQGTFCTVCDRPADSETLKAYIAARQ